MKIWQNMVFLLSGGSPKCRSCTHRDFGLKARFKHLVGEPLLEYSATTNKYIEPILNKVGPKTSSTWSYKRPLFQWPNSTGVNVHPCFLGGKISPLVVRIHVDELSFLKSDV